MTNTGTTSPLEIANIFDLNMLDENVSPVDIASSVDDIVVRNFIATIDSLFKKKTQTPFNRYESRIDTIPMKQRLR